MEVERSLRLHIREILSLNFIEICWCEAKSVAIEVEVMRRRNRSQKHQIASPPPLQSGCATQLVAIEVKTMAICQGNVRSSGAQQSQTGDIKQSANTAHSRGCEPTPSRMREELLMPLVTTESPPPAMLAGFRPLSARSHSHLCPQLKMERPFHTPMKPCVHSAQGCSRPHAHHHAASLVQESSPNPSLIPSQMS